MSINDLVIYGIIITVLALFSILADVVNYFDKNARASDFSTSAICIVCTLSFWFLVLIEYINISFSKMY